MKSLFLQCSAVLHNVWRNIFNPSRVHVLMFTVDWWCVFLAEIVMLEGLTCVYRSNVDLFFYVVGSAQENEVGYVLLSLITLELYYFILYTYLFVGMISGKVLTEF